MNKNLIRITTVLLFAFFASLNVKSQVTSHMVTHLPYTACVGSPVMFTAIDTTGNFQNAFHWWYFSDGGSASGSTFSPSVSHIFTAPGTYTAWFSAWDSITFASDSGSVITIEVDSICTNHDYISGVVYYDSNGNGNQDPGDPELSNQMIRIDPGPYYLTTDQNGGYGVNLPTGSYTFTVVPAPYYVVTEPVPGSYSITSTGSSAIISGNDFGLHPMSNINDLRIDVYGVPPVPGFQRTYTLAYRNVGTTVLSGTVEFNHDPQLSFVSANSGGVHAGNSTTWSYSNLQPGQIRNVTTTMLVPVSTVIGSVLRSVAVINPIPGDTTPANNVDSLVQTVVASYDPNDKLALPAGIGASGDIAPNTPISYTIRFQNTGTFYATNVVIRDTLDQDFDQQTLEVLGGSHTFNWFNDYGKLTFDFSNIMLPDSNTNEPASHGWVRYRIQHRAGLPLGTQLTNSASIYFDFNAPILTNTTLHTLANPVAISQPFTAGTKVTVAPNPFTGQTMIRYENPGSAPHHLEVTDLTGKLVGRIDGGTGQSILFDASGVKNGMYIYRLISEAGIVATGKMIIN